MKRTPGRGFPDSVVPTVCKTHTHSMIQQTTHGTIKVLVILPITVPWFG